ncbi:MAG: hypothetical protein JWP34_4818 [Massilia sp.]|jgi:hypothetical protein|nr:hypothetical protein [Massilia sp.]
MKSDDKELPGINLRPKTGSRKVPVGMCISIVILSMMAVLYTSTYDRHVYKDAISGQRFGSARGVFFVARVSELRPYKGAAMRANMEFGSSDLRDRYRIYEQDYSIRREFMGFRHEVFTVIPPWGWDAYSNPVGVGGPFPKSCVTVALWTVPHWPLLLMAGLPLILRLVRFVYSDWKSQIWVRKGLCPHCGYDTRASRAVCSEWDQLLSSGPTDFQA